MMNPLRHVPLSLTIAAPKPVDPQEAAQHVADALRVLDRAGTGERYPARADIVLSPEQPTAVELADSGHRPAPGTHLVVLLALVWARRPGDADEERAVLADVRARAAALCEQRWQTDYAVAIPIGEDTIAWAARRADRVVRTSDPADGLIPDPLMI